MIAAALGAEVFAGPEKEIGFGPVTVHDAAGPLHHLADVPVLHWHGDTFTLPEGTELLASSAAYRHQAFRRGRNLLALQFHAEMGEDERFEDWIAQDMDYLSAAGRCPEALRAEHGAHGPRAVAAGRAMIAEWLAGLAA
jgi:GMP synthase (glutamine-hydrolysing)